MSAISSAAKHLFPLSQMFLCNSCQPMHFFCYASTIGGLADTVDILLISVTADTILLFYPISAAT
jgi:hypothetical protein